MRIQSTLQNRRRRFRQQRLISHAFSTPHELASPSSLPSLPSTHLRRILLPLAKLRKLMLAAMLTVVLISLLAGCTAATRSVLDGDRPHWIAGGRVLPQALELLELAQSVDQYGIAKPSRQIQELEGMIADGHEIDPGYFEPLEKGFDELFNNLTYALLNGSLSSSPMFAEFSSQPEKISIASLVETTAQPAPLAESFKSLLPRHIEYRRLQNALSRYREIARNGGWKTISTGSELMEGDKGERVQMLRTRLQESDDLLPAHYAAAGSPGHRVTAGTASDVSASRLMGEEHAYFDASLSNALRHFQKRHGLEPSGILDSLTIHQLNVPVEVRIRQLEMNLERWRWLPRELGYRHVLVDIPAMELRLFVGGQAVMKSPVIVGQPSSKTPVFTASITSFVTNPFWVVPDSITFQELAPRIKEDPSFLTKNEIRVEDGKERSNIVRDPLSINWDKIDRENPGFVLVQRSGGSNPMGNLKFVIPGNRAIYIHDTPDKDLFNEKTRLFSHGCVRLKEPVKLAAYLQGNSDPLSAETELTASLATGQEMTHPLDPPVPVHFVYFTAAVDDDGVVSFRPDIYGYDRALYKLMLDRLAFTE